MHSRSHFSDCNRLQKKESETRVATQNQSEKEHETCGTGSPSSAFIMCAAAVAWGAPVRGQGILGGGVPEVSVGGAAAEGLGSRASPYAFRSCLIAKTTTARHARVPTRAQRKRAAVKGQRKKHRSSSGWRAGFAMRMRMHMRMPNVRMPCACRTCRERPRAGASPRVGRSGGCQVPAAPAATRTGCRLAPHLST